MDSSWFKSRLTPAKQNSVLWSPLATMVQSLFASFADPYLTRVSNKKSIFTMDDSDLDTRIAELGKFFTIRTSDASSKPMLLQQRLDEIHFKGTERPITQTFYREFDGVPITWQPLYAPVDTEKYPYGTVLISSDTLDSVGHTYGEMFLTSRGVISVSINDLMAAIDSGDLELDSGDTTQAAVTEAALTRFKQYVKPLLPCHIVFDGLSLYISQSEDERPDEMHLISLSDTAGQYGYVESGDTASAGEITTSMTLAAVTAGPVKDFTGITFDRELSDGAVLDYTEKGIFSDQVNVWASMQDETLSIAMDAVSSVHVTLNQIEGDDSFSFTHSVIYSVTPEAAETDSTWDEMVQTFDRIMLDGAALDN